ncbi:MAG: ABC transporter ATP-binding protein, partial [Dehalococcoidia bacterium]
MLEIKNLNAGYGSIQVLRDVSLAIEPGEVVAVLGTNGAGKSTLLRTISGLIHPRGGSIKYHGRDIGGLSPDAIVRRGIVHVPEGRRIFAQMTVLENLMMGAFTHKEPKTIHSDLEFVFVLFPDLEAKQGQWGGELSGGQQQMLAIGRALMSRPTVL